MLAVLFGNSRRDHDDRQTLQALVGTDVTGQIKTIHTRHFDVRQDHHGTLVLQTFQCLERFATACLDAFGTGELQPVLDRTFPFDNLADAHAYMMSDSQVGKIVVTMD